VALAEVVQLPVKRSCWECTHSTWSPAGPYCMLFDEDVSLTPAKTAVDCETYERDPDKD